MSTPRLRMFERRGSGLAAWITGLVLLQSAIAEAGWVDEQSFGRFDCRADFRLSLEPQLGALLAQLEVDVLKTLGIEPPQERIELCLFENRAQYLKFVAPRVPSAAPRRAFYIKGEGTGRVYAYRNPFFEIDVRHETTHALLHAALAFVPSWLDEGLAEYFELPADQRVSRNPHLKSLKLVAPVGWRPKLVALEAKRDLADLGRKEYRESWAWVHFMLHGPPEAGELLRNYLSAIQSGNPPGPLSTHLERRLPDAEQLVVEHIRNWKT